MKAAFAAAAIWGEFVRILKPAAVACCFASFGAVPGAGSASAQTAPNPGLEYKSVTPCRAFDTRATAPVAANTTRSFHISGSHDFPGQGGPEHGCGVPTYATSVSMSLTAVNEADAGYLTAFAYKAARPLITSLYYQRNVTVVSGLISAINQGNISIYSSKQTHVVGDVTGYFAPPITASVNPTGQAYHKTSRVLSVQQNVLTGYY
ncbi:MAG: hypothetical protein ABW275_01315, partial [Hansschlegelia sp.]